MEETKEANQKLRKIGQTVSQTHTRGPEHNKIQTQWASDSPSKIMLEKV